MKLKLLFVIFLMIVAVYGNYSIRNFNHLSRKGKRILDELMTKIADGKEITSNNFKKNWMLQNSTLESNKAAQKILTLILMKGWQIRCIEETNDSIMAFYLSKGKNDVIVIFKNNLQGYKVDSISHLAYFKNQIEVEN